MEFYQFEERSLLRRIISWMVDIILVIACAWFTVYTFGTEVTVAGSSMSPYMENEDVVLMNRLSYELSSPDRFDVVVFRREDGRVNVKRVIGLPGETVQIYGGYVFIDGERLKADNGLDEVSLAGLAETPVTLGEDEYFLLGDNRDSSEDSRFINVGNVKKDQILGKVWIRILPVRRFSLIGP
ncbi:MAG TPA: signal peptidase I [Candidatus Lachnoclostridium stercoravium]|uniref:Signal peptidase I n=1 Tax=Candidatus Lachnoclostridium stercoravium TaxID=2838633 RepID=A0A9D2HJ75_9FIRM|nr:signal peptidase I [Candidatus Lachnoclostridium stercoravium]